MLTLLSTLTLAISDKAKAEKLGSKKVCVHSAKIPTRSQANSLFICCSEGLCCSAPPSLKRTSCVTWTLETGAWDERCVNEESKQRVKKRRERKGIEKERKEKRNNETRESV